MWSKLPIDYSLFYGPPHSRRWAITVSRLGIAYKWIGVGEGVGDCFGKGVGDAAGRVGSGVRDGGRVGADVGGGVGS